MLQDTYYLTVRRISRTHRPIVVQLSSAELKAKFYHLTDAEQYVTYVFLFTPWCDVVPQRTV